MNPAKAEMRLPTIKGTPWSKLFSKWKPEPLFLDLIT